MITEHHNAAQIAAEVAARYGATVSPDIAVTVVPSGVMATAIEYRWNGRDIEAVNKDAGSWREAIKAKAKRDMAARNRKAALSERPQAPKPKQVRADDPRLIAAEQRREAVRQFAVDKTIDEIAAFLGATVSGARKFLARYDIAYRHKAPARRRASPEREEYVTRFNAGEAVEAIAASAGVAVQSVCKVLRNAGLKPRVQRKEAAPVKRVRATGRRQAHKREIAERQAKVRELAAQGLTSAQIAASIGVKERLVQCDRAAMGISAASGFQTMPEEMARRIAERRVKVLALRKAGKVRREIAAELGISTGLVSVDLKALGVTIPLPAPALSNPEVVQRVRDLNARQMSVKEIAVAMSIARSTVQRILERAA